MTSSSFGELLKQLMCNAHISDSALAKSIGVDRQTIFRWKTNKTLPQNREPLLLCLKKLRIHDNLEQCNQFLKFAQHPILNAEEIKTYLKLLPDALIFQQKTQQPFQTLIQNILNNFLKNRYPMPLMLLSPDQQQPVWFFDALLSNLAPYYKNNCFHFVPPASETIDERLYFKNLTAHYNTLNAIDANQFEINLRNHILKYGKTFILVSRFEQGSFQYNKLFARILRNVFEINSEHLHLLMFGGEQLARFKYETNPQHSLLNMMNDALWLELSVEDILCFAEEQLFINLDKTQAEQILSLSGGHFYLIKQHLHLYKTNPQLKIEHHSAILHHNRPIEITTIFTRLIQQGYRYQLLNLLEKNEILSSEKPPIFLNHLLHHLYWKNLLRYEQGLFWRCETIRQIGLGCY